MVDQVITELRRAALHEFGDAIENLSAHHCCARCPWLGSNARDTNRFAQILARTPGNVGNAALRKLDLSTAARFAAWERATDVELGGASHLKAPRAL